MRSLVTKRRLVAREENEKATQAGGFLLAVNIFNECDNSFPVSLIKTVFIDNLRKRVDVATCNAIVMICPKRDRRHNAIINLIVRYKYSHHSHRLVCLVIQASIVQELLKLFSVKQGCILPVFAFLPYSP